MSRFLIYGLRDPRTMEIRYVGRSSSGSRRPKAHTISSQLARDKTYKGNWIRSLARDGLTPEIVVLEYLDFGGEILNEAEKRWIKIGKDALRERFTNLTDGGDGISGYRHTTKTLYKKSVQMRELWSNTEFHKTQIVKIKKALNTSTERARLRDQAIKAWADSETRKKRTQTAIETYADPEVRLAVSRGVRAAWLRPEVRKNYTLSMKEIRERPGFYEKIGKTISAIRLSPEVNKKIRLAAVEVASRPDVRAKKSETMRQRWADPVAREKLLAAQCKQSQGAIAQRIAKTAAKNTGKTRTPEQCARISAAIRLSNARKKETGHHVK